MLSALATFLSTNGINVVPDVVVMITTLSRVANGGSLGEYGDATLYSHGGSASIHVTAQGSRETGMDPGPVVYGPG